MLECGVQTDDLVELVVLVDLLHGGGSIAARALVVQVDAFLDTAHAEVMAARRCVLSVGL